MPTRVSWSLKYRTVTEEEQILLRHHMEMFRNDGHVAHMEVAESPETPFMTDVRVEFANDVTGPENPELRSLHQLRGEGTFPVEDPEHTSALTQTPRQPPVSPEEFQRGLETLGTLLESIPRALEPVVNMVNAFGLAMRTGFAAMTPPPPPPPEEPRRTSWERILEDDDDPV